MKHQPTLKSKRKWTAVFGRTQIKQVYSMKGTRRLCSRAFCRCEANPDWLRATRAFRAAGLKEEVSGSSSPVNATEYRYVFSILGGKFTTVGGDYWGGKHGAFVEGIRPLRYLCYLLSLTQPRRLASETTIPTFEELKFDLLGSAGGSTNDQQSQDTGNASHIPSSVQL